MSNSLTTNPIVIDTFSSDVTISSTPITVSSIIFWSTGADDKVLLEDSLGVLVFYVQLATAKDTFAWTPAKPHTFQNGLYLDVSDGTYTTASRMLIYSV